MSEYHPGLRAVCDQYHATAVRVIDDLLTNPGLQQSLADEGPEITMMRIIRTARDERNPQLTEFYFAAALIRLLEHGAAEHQTTPVAVPVDRVQKVREWAHRLGIVRSPACTLLGVPFGFRRRR